MQDVGCVFYVGGKVFLYLLYGISCQRAVIGTKTYVLNEIPRGEKLQGIVFADAGNEDKTKIRNLIFYDGIKVGKFIV